MSRLERQVNSSRRIDPRPTRSDESHLGRRWVTWSYSWAGVFLFGYAAVRWWSGRDGVRGPDAWWFWGHLMFLVSQVMVATILVDLLRRLRLAYLHLPRTISVISVISWIGVLGKYAAIAQTVIDLVVGLRASDKPEMTSLFRQVQSVPGVKFAVYDVLPWAFYVGVLLQVWALCLRNHRSRSLIPALVLTLSLGTAVDLDLLPVSAILLQITFVAIRPRAIPRDR